MPSLVAADPDLPSPSANLELIPAGSLVIPMDNDKQNLVAPFNLKAYGLVNELLWNEIPVKWAVRAGKAKDGIDFTAQAQRLLPTALAPATLDFRAGPFIVHADWADFALPKITAWGNQVAVYELTQDATVDIRHDILQKRKVGVLDDGGNAAIHAAFLDNAGFVSGTHYEIIGAASLLTVNANSCLTSVSEPHFDSDSSDSETEGIRAFVAAGGNFLAECVAITTYENNVAFGLFQTTNGIVEDNLGESYLYPNPDLPFSQFEGTLASVGGSVHDFMLAAGSTFRPSSHLHAQDTPSTDHYAATATKVNAAGLGSLVFYLGGHNYGNGDIPSMNGRRMYMNHVLTPSVRPGACGFDFGDDPSALKRISGTVYEDVDGDANLADAVAVAGVRVRVYSDLNANGLIDAGDGFAGEINTDPAGDYSFQVNAGVQTEYLVAVDSTTVPPSAAFNGGSGQGDVWAEQTYGDDPTTLAVDLGARFGGRSGGVSDDVHPTLTDPASNEYQHLGRVDLSAGDVAGVDFAFSFNVVTNERGGDNTDDDPSANRTIQGSLRQFLANAAALGGANAMRFVPATAANQGTWWRVTVSVDLPVIDDAATIVDGTAYSASDGVTVRNDNTAALGAGGTVGVNGLPLPTLDPELELASPNRRPIGLHVQAADVTLRGLAIYGFGDKANDNAKANVRVGNVTGTLIEQNVIGAGAGSFSDPGTTALADDIRIVNGDGGTIRDNLIGFSGGNGIGMRDNVDGWLIEGNEIRGNATSDNTLNGVFMENSGAATLRGNLVADNAGAGLDLDTPTAASTIENNSFTQNGTGGAETPGIRLFGSGHLVDRNVIFENFGAGVMVTSASTQNVITLNSIYDNGTIGAASGQIGIDLLAGGDDQARGSDPFVTLNDAGDTDTGGNDLLNYPLLDSATISGTELILTGFARPGSAIEWFIAAPDPRRFGEGKTYLLTLVEGSVDDLDATTGTYGPGPVNNFDQGSDTTNRFRFEIPVPGGVSKGTFLTATATLGGSTSEFSGNVAVGPLTISGTVYEDPDGDANLADGVPQAGVEVRLYLDGGDGLPDGVDDSVVTSDVTDVAGSYEFDNLGKSTYWLTADSKDLAPAGLNGGFVQGDTWAEQTHGPAGSLCADGSGGTAEHATAGACYAGRQGGVSDDASTLAISQHVVKVVLTDADVAGLDFGFGFNVVTHEGGGDNTDDDPSANRTVQGSLRQFLANANAISGSNAMRFVPATAPDQGTWWRVSVSVDLPDIDDADTTVDGLAYALADGVAVRDENTAGLGAGGAVGVDGLPLATLDPELELVAATDGRTVGLDVQANDVTVRDLAIYGFGNNANDNNKANIRIGDVTGALIERNVLGAGAGSFTDPGTQAVADNLRVLNGDDGTIRDNLIGFSGGNGIGLRDTADGWLIEGNEIRGNGTDKTEMNGVRNENGGSTTVRGNLIVDNKGTGVDTLNGTGGHTVENNTITGNGVGDKETAGVRLWGTGSTVDRNVIFENFGAGVMVTALSTQNLITRNSIYDNGTILSDAGGGPSDQIGIDLLEGGDDDKKGSSPYYTLNDIGDGDGDANTLFNFPILESATVATGNLILTGFARPGSTIELFVADPDPSGFGEGKTYKATLVEGSVDDLDATTGSYGPGPINGIAQGEDTTNRFRFELTRPIGIGAGTVLTATATDASNNTSEFSGGVTVTGSPSACNSFVTEDTWLQESAPTVNHGTDVELSSKNAPADDMRPVIRYGFAVVPFASTVIEARAWFYVTTKDDSGDPVNVHRVTDSWTEAGATWNNTAADYDASTVHGSLLPTTTGWISVDLTDLVQGWVNSVYPNYGIMFLSTSNAVESKYTSKEWPTSSEFSCLEVNFTPPVSLSITKRAFEPDGTPIPNGTQLARGTPVSYLLYVNNPGALRPDVSVQDVLDSAFAYQPGTIKVDNSLANCAAATCTAAEEAAIFAAVDARTPNTDAVDGDTVSYTAASTTIDAGDQNQSNARLDVNANSVWALSFSVKVQ